MPKATLKMVRDFFAANGGTPLKMEELKEIKASNGGLDYDQIAEGIGDGTLTY